MKKTYLLLICLLLSFSAEAERTSLLQTPSGRDSIERYMLSGNYNQEIQAKLEEAWRYLDHRIQNQQNEKLAIVLDIDETALSYYDDLKRNAFTGNSEAAAAAYMLANGKAIEPILNLYQYAIQQKVDVFFITGRPATPEITNATTQNLRAAGYNSWAKLYLRPIENDTMSISDYKTRARKEISNLGYTIILNIGDQEVDLKGGFSEANIKLPNPFYKTT
ncbi:MAG: HAD family acid phosphatase [Gammaproteobacteria bacterium]